MTEPTKFEARATAATVNRIGETLYSDFATRVEIVDEAGGEFVEVSQAGRENRGTIAISPEEWPLLREAIDTLIDECRDVE